MLFGLLRKAASRPMVWALLTILGSVAWQNRPVDRSVLFPAIFPNSLWGYVNDQGLVAVPPAWDGVRDFHPSGVAWVLRREKWGLIDRTGAVIRKPAFNAASPFDTGGLAAVRKWDRFGFVDTQGDVVIPIDLELAEPFDGKEHALALKDGKSFLMDRQGKVVQDFDWRHRDDFATDSLSRAEKDGRVGFVDRDGNVVIPFEWDAAEPFDPFARLAVAKRDGKFGFIDREGRVAIPLKWDDARSFQYGIGASVELGDQVGTIDEKGNLRWPMTPKLAGVSGGGGRAGQPAFMAMGGKNRVASFTDGVSGKTATVSYEIRNPEPPKMFQWILSWKLAKYDVGGPSYAACDIAADDGRVIWRNGGPSGLPVEFLWLACGGLMLADGAWLIYRYRAKARAAMRNGAVSSREG